MQVAIHLFRTILLIRLKQLWRLIQSIGWILLFLLIVAFGGIFLAILESLSKAPELAWTLLVATLFLTIHFSRDDVAFLRKLNISPPVFFMIEYLCGLIPLLLIMAVMGKWQDLLTSVFVTILISRVPTGHWFKGPDLQVSSDIIPLRAFEIRSGIRQRTLTLAFLYIVGLTLSWFFPFAYIIMLLLLALVVSSFFEAFESKEIIETIYLPQRSLFPKLLLTLGVFHTLLLPFHLLFLVRFTTYWYVGLAAVGMGSLTLAFSLYYKYAGYYPNRLRVYNQTPVGIFFLSVLVPFFWPGIIIYLIVKWRKAEQALRHYFL